MIKCTLRNSFFKIYILFALLACKQPVMIKAQLSDQYTYTNDASTINGAERISVYLPELTNKRVAIVANHTSMVGNTHLVDTLLSLKVNVIRVFAPEHGFRGIADAGEKITTSIDEKTELPIISLYGKNKKPTADQLKDIDIVLFDIQDVGARFYTYISTMTYVMEACAESNKKIIILDRPNPNGYYVDGPVLQKDFTSFVGLHPVPIVHGMTVGEYAQMVNGEKWLTNGVQCDLKVIIVENYDHHTLYMVPIPPSPNLKTMEAIYLYPTTCLFEGTVLSVGRGTDNPFTVAGHPNYTNYKFSFIPRSMPGAKEPKFKDKTCFGIDFTEWNLGGDMPLEYIHIDLICELFKNYPAKDVFFTDFFNQLVGNATVKQDIIKGNDSDKIRFLWQNEVADFKVIRKKYLLYTDFE